jgi:broad specificity phosphatase PhoE
MKHIYFVRHGESMANKARVREDGSTPLTDQGFEQAVKVAERFSRIPIDVVLSSSYVRAKHTAQAIADVANAALEEMADAHERVHPSQLIGVSRDAPDARAIIEQMESAWRSGGPKHSDEESFAEYMARVDRTINALRKRPESRIVLVSHRFFLKTIFARLAFGEDLTADNVLSLAHLLDYSNTGITYFQYDDSKWKLITWNDHAHLG